ncbi:globin D, coelomic-like [Daphnia carinata]|uniref:globin D, coelomic-like n=1 Tax=Daphnia carinata TaxID=120202 RepID=UPI002579B0DB|nr:globin D, coelomic-like [Daphnia carinata]
MNNSVVIFRNLLSLLASWSVYNEQNANGDLISDSSGLAKTSGSPRTDNPFITASIVTTVHDYRNEVPTAMHSYAADDNRNYRTGENTMFDGTGLRGKISGDDINVLISSWDFLKKRLSDFAPKIFLRYFSIRPDARMMFPAFAHVTKAELPYNRDFLSTTYNCIASLNYIIPHLRYSLPEQCPAFASLKNKYSKLDLKRLENIWLNVTQEEMGDNFTDVIRDSWKKVFFAFFKFTYE